MASVINTNIASLNAQRNLSMSQSSLSTALQRLSSGLRINSAKDDAAGLAISARMTTQINGLNQATRNANDAISLSQTADGALGEVTNNLQRIRELAIQAANGTNTAADRSALNAEVQQRLAEIDRISSQTSFNGQKILDGSLGTANFQVGANVGESISVNLSSSTRLANTGSIASVSTVNLATAASAATSGKITFSPSTFNFGVAAAAQVDGKNVQAAAASFSNFDFSGGAVAGINQQTITQTDFSGAGLAQFDITQGANTAHITLTGNYTNAAGVASAIQTQLQAQTGFTTATVTQSGNKFTFTGVGANAVAISNVDTNATAAGLVASSGSAGAANANASFSVDGNAVSLTTNIASGAALATAIQGQLTGYTASWSNVSGLTITHTGSTAAVAITGANASAVLNAGISNTAGTAGTAAVSSTNASFTADGQSVTLNANYGSMDGLATAIATQMNTAVPGTYTVTNSNGALTIARTTTGTSSAAVNITAASGFSANAGISVSSGTAGTNAVVGGIAAGAFTLASGDLTLAAGTNTAVDLAGSYSNLQGLVDAINSKVSDVNASTSGGVLTITSARAINAGGTKSTLAAASGGFGLAASTAASSGSLASADVLTTSSANTTIQRIDSALESVNSLRGTFGAIQNRFESTIANLQSTSENLSAARSRIQDTDFAAETANLTRAQILQQAGTAMLAQANSLPNQVLSLLKG